MKSVLISIQPKWCELIASGKKTVEVRKTRPKLKAPFKCYIYCTQGKLKDLGIIGETMYRKRMKVIGEFVCDCIAPLYNVCYDEWERLLGVLQGIEKKFVEFACLTENELHSYANGKNCYAWHISDLVIYDKPKSLNDFHLACDREKCGKCKRSITHKLSCNAGLTRPPQNWCYVESEG